MEGLPIPLQISAPGSTARGMRRARAAALAPKALAPCALLAALAMSGLSPSVSASVPVPVPSGTSNGRIEAQQASSEDTVYAVSARTGKRSVVNGTVTENGLAQVVLMRGDKEARFESAEVERIAWGGVSPAMREADVYFDRGDFENAAAKYRQALDLEERDVVKAVARMRAGESLLRLGASDPTKFAEAVADFDSFISEYSKNRALPQVRWMKARAALLAGDAATAATEFGALYNEGAGTTPTPGYDPLLCARAGVAGAQAQLAAGDTLAARDMFGGVRSRLSAMLSQAEPGNPAALQLEMLAAEADLGEGFALIAGSQGAQAKTFFQARLSNSNASPASRFGAMLGLAEAHYQMQEFSDARILFARVAALDFTSRDRVAQANLRLAQCRIQLKEGEWKPAAKAGLEQVIGTYGDTPAAFEARQVLETL